MQIQRENIAMRYREELDKIAGEGIESGILEYDENAENAEQIFEFSQIDSGKGKAVYSSFSDQELCNILIQKTKELEHVPAQKEIYWLYRVYLKRRFGNWPKALTAAGLSKKAGKGGDSYEKVKTDKLLEKELLDKLRAKAEELGRPPHMHEMKEAADYFKIKFSTWAELLDAAGLDNQWKSRKPVYQVTDLSEEDKELLEIIHKKAIELGRPPMRTEIPGEIRETLKKKCGTWRNILYQIGLEPIQKIRSFNATYLDGRGTKTIKHTELLEGSVFKLVNPDENTVRQLNLLRKKADQVDRTLVKAEIPKDIYNNLIEQCVNYRNILYQIGLEPMEKLKEKEIEKELRKKRR